MATNTSWRRMQVLVSAEQYNALRATAAERRVSMGELVRGALSRELQLPTVEERLAIVKRMAEMDLPVADWPQMEREIEEGRLRGCNAGLP